MPLRPGSQFSDESPMLYGPIEAQVLGPMRTLGRSEISTWVAPFTVPQYGAIGVAVAGGVAVADWQPGEDEIWTVRYASLVVFHVP